MIIKVYVEGGGSTPFTRDPLRDGFDGFFRDLKLLAHDNGCELTFILCGGKTETIRDFKKALKYNNNAIKVLLIDSDGPVTELPREYLKIKDPEITDDQCHLMVQFMESWFIADLGALRKFYNATTINKFFKPYEDVVTVENIDQSEIEQALNSASESTGLAAYTYRGKINQAIEILEKLNLDIVRKKAPHCDRFCIAIENFIRNIPTIKYKIV